MQCRTLKKLALAAIAAKAVASHNCQHLSANETVQELHGRLSPSAKIIMPSEPAFTDLTSRWSTLGAPQPNMVVLVASESDVVETVRFSNQKDVPFLVYVGTHGTPTTLGKMTCGIAINLKKLSSVHLGKDGRTAAIGGGTMSKTVVDELWAVGKQTVTGTCECVSLLGPGLGGGHGWLQGHHGLIADQFVSMNVVLASGQLETVDAGSDLFWAMKGAGHNFGVVTSVVMTVYDIQHTNWAVETIIYSGEQVAQVYELSNRYLVRPSVGITSWSYWMNLPDVDPSNPVIILYIIQEGVTAVNPDITKPFLDIKPLSAQSTAGTYRDVSKWTMIALDSPPCQQFGTANPRFPLYLQDYPVPAMQQAYTMFASHVRGSSSSFRNSIFLFEGYAMEAVKAIDSASTAFPFREANVLSASLIVYQRNDTSDAEARELGNALRRLLHSGTGLAEMRAYVNYAYGDEAPWEWYGSEPWRLDRLRALKEKYDPEGRFDFYVPVNQEPEIGSYEPVEYAFVPHDEVPIG